MNTITVIGNLTKMPELEKYGETTVCRMAVAVEREYNPEKVDFFNVTVFGKNGENCNKYLDKGSKVGIRGRMESSVVEKDGKKTTFWGLTADKVEFLSPKKQENDAPQSEERKLEPVYIDDLPF